MAQVVLEKIYKTFPHRSKAAVRTSTPAEETVPSSSLRPSADSPAIAEQMGEAHYPAPVSRRERPSQSALPNSSSTVLRDINLTVHDGEFLVLVGPSGCGKSTLLRLIAGLESLTGGNIWVGDRRITDLPPKQRDIAMVFQNYALYPHLTVYNNLAFGLRRMGQENSPDDDQTLPEEESKPSSKNSEQMSALQQKLQRWGEEFLTRITRAFPDKLRYWSEQERQVDQRVKAVAQTLQIEALLDRLPRQLSGGQKQRVALGRAMARNPQAFLMDEPLSNLDAKLRTETRTQIVNLQRKLKTTTIYVTHDQTEAMTMGDRIVVLNGGQIQQIATPIELYTRPVNRFVAEFIGTLPMNFLEVEVKAPCVVVHPAFRLTLPDTWTVPLRRYDGRSLILGIRPEHLSLSVPAPKNIPVRVERIETLGSDTHLTVRVSDESSLGQSPIRLQIRVSPDQSTFVDEKLWISLTPQKVHLFDPTTHNAILPTALEPDSHPSW